jgi:hypothetical protein
LCYNALDKIRDRTRVPIGYPVSPRRAGRENPRWITGLDVRLSGPHTTPWRQTNMATEIILHTRTDVLTRTVAREIIEFVEGRLGPINFVSVLDFVPSNRPISFDEIVEYAIDALNEDAPVGTWYKLTADHNIAADYDGSSEYV